MKVKYHQSNQQVLLVLVAHFGTDEGRSTFLFRPKYLLFKFLI